MKPARFPMPGRPFWAPLACLFLGHFPERVRWPDGLHHVTCTRCGREVALTPLHRKEVR